VDRITKDNEIKNEEIQQLKSYIQTLENKSSIYGKNRTNTNEENKDNQPESDLFQPSQLNTASISSSTSISDLNLNNPKDAEMYVQKLRAHYGREINELRNHLELLRTTIQENNTKRNQERDEWKELVNKSEKTMQNIKQQHKEELDMVRNELQRALQIMKEEKEEDIQTLRAAHQRELEAVYEQQRDQQSSLSSSSAPSSSDYSYIRNLRDTLQTTQDELKQKIKEYTELQIQYKTLETRYEVQTKQVDTLLEDIEKNKDNLDKLHNQLHHYEQENKQYKSELDNLQTLHKLSTTAASNNSSNEVTINDTVQELVRKESIRIHHDAAAQVLELKEQLAEATKRAEHFEALHQRHEEYMEEMRVRSEDELEAAINACGEAEERAVAAEKKIQELEGKLKELLK